MLASAAAMAAPAGPGGELIRRNDDSVAQQLAAQITDATHPQLGGAPDAYGLYSAYPAAGLLLAGSAALASQGSRFYRSDELRRRLLLAVKYLEGKQHADGTIDLLTTNFHSTPDLGFVVHNVAGAAWIARRHGEPGLFAALEPFLTRAGAALAAGHLAVDLPSHRATVAGREVDLTATEYAQLEAEWQKARAEALSKAK